jgi:hypothetical protein
MSDPRGGPDFYRLFDSIGEMRAEIRANREASFNDARALREMIAGFAATIDARHRENQTDIKDVRDQIRRINDEAVKWQQEASFRFDKIERQNVASEHKVDELKVKITEIEPAVKDIAALRTRFMAILAAAASIIGGIWFLMAPLWKYMSDWVGALIVGKH